MINVGMKSLELPSIIDFTVTFEIAGCGWLKYSLLLVLFNNN